MPTNRFEKQVQERLDEFQLNPSAAVWENVEALIRRKRKRRFILYFILPTAIGLLSLLAIYMRPGGEKSPVVANTSIEENKQVVKKPAARNDQSAMAAEEKILNEINQSETTQATDLIHQSIIKVDQEESTFNNQPSPKTQQELTNQNRIASKRESATGNKKLMKDQDVRQNDIARTNARTQESNPLNNEEEKNIEATELKTKDELTKTNVSAKKDSVAIDSAQVIKSDTSSRVLPTDFAEAKAPQQGQPSKKDYRLGVTLSTGLTSTRSSIFSLPVWSNSPDQFSQYPYPSTGSGIPSSPPSEVKPGVSFSAALIGEKKVSNRIALTAGLGYSYQSTRIKAGMKKDTSINVPITNLDNVPANGYYAVGEQRDYANSYHFIQLPISMQWKVSAKLPIYVNAGLTASYLVSTNALIYSPTLGGVYYRDKESYNRFHVSLSSGIEAAIRMKGGRELFIGPTLGMDMTNLLKKKYNRDSYLLFGGIQARFMFTKK